MAKNKENRFINRDIATPKIETRYINKNAATLLGSNDNGDDLKVIISFIHLQNSYQCFSEWSKTDMESFWNFYKKIHEITWQQVYASSGKSQKTGLGYTKISIDKYPSPVFKEQLSEDITIFELRVNQKSRVHGFRNKAVFYICWLDRNHTIME